MNNQWAKSIYAVTRQDRQPPRAAIYGGEKNPAVLPAVGVFCANSPQLAEPGGTSSKLLKILFMLTLKELASAVQLRPWPPRFRAVRSAKSTKLAERELGLL